MEKKKINKEQATQMLINYFNENMDLEDRVYELAQDICNQQINEIDEKYSVLDEDGQTYDGSDGLEWYDDARVEFIETFFDKLKQWFDEQHCT